MAEYEITETGQVFSLPNKTRLTRRELRLATDKDGYKIVSLQIDGKGKMFKVHRLVAKQYLPNPDNKLTVNHIDENKANNHVSNLEWATFKENNHHSLTKQYESMRGAGSINPSGLVEEDIKDIRLFCNKGITRKAIAKMYKVSESTIGRIFNNEVWSHI